MDISTMSIEQIQAALDARNGTALDPLSAALDARAGLAFHKPLGQWTSDDVAAMRARVNQVLKEGR
jgi:hypothetical protein